MNRNNLKKYAPEARRDFIRAVTDRASFYGLTKRKTEPVTVEGDVAIINGRPFPKKVAEQRKRLVEKANRLGFDQVMEAVAYTWFNRLVAIRYMELHGYLDHGYRVLSHPEGDVTPEIVEHAEHLDLPGLDKQKVISLKLDGTKESELYRMLLIAQCNALHKAMPFLFEHIGDETELLLPDNLLHSDSLIRTLVKEIPEEDWREVEIIGWLYQFYISEKKDEVIGKVVKSEDIPAATQLFTPNWIVKYLVQNSLGRQWMATYPNSSLKVQMEYYIEPAEQTPDVLEQLKAITPESLSPEELTLLDPACGSGHILVEAYDLLKAIYQERGYRATDIPRLILEKNLFGLEIDDRAAQLAAFALMMKARADDRRIFHEAVQLHVLAIQESNGLDAKEITEALNQPIFKGEAPPPESLFEEIDDEKAPLFSRRNLAEPGGIPQSDIARLIELFEHGKTLGSLIQIPDALAPRLDAITQRAEAVMVHGGMLERGAIRLLCPIIEQALLLERKYGLLVSNPPYMGSGWMNTSLKELARQPLYETGRNDLCTLFILRARAFAAESGHISFVTMHTWMFLSSFEEFRRSLLNTTTFAVMAHFGIGAFSELNSKVVQTTAFVLRLGVTRDFSGTFQRLIHGNEDTKRYDLSNGRHRYDRAQRVFVEIPGRQIAYWMSDRVLEIFSHFPTLGDITTIRQGMTTGNGSLYLRFWYEINIGKAALPTNEIAQSDVEDKKWVPYNKGGKYRKWYGNREYVLNFENDGAAMKADAETGTNPGFRMVSRDYFFRPGVTWTDINSGYLAARSVGPGFAFENTGSMIFSEEPKREVVLGFLCSTLASHFMRVLNPTLHFTVGEIKKLPFRLNCKCSDSVEKIACRLRDISCNDWNTCETSWDFEHCPLLCSDGIRRRTIEESYETWVTTQKAAFVETQTLETALNRLLIQAYELENEINPEVSDERVTLSTPNQEEDIKRLVSYAIGCMMGRYSLDKPGLIYAHSGGEGFDTSQYQTFPADADGIVPITDSEWFDDDAANRLEDFIATAWPKENLEENLKFIADSLGPNKGERPRETIRRYLSTGLHKHHMQLYRKRPIYWLFFSGKQRAFQCLVYLHRYNEGTLSRMRTEYVIPLSGQMASRIDQLEGDIAAASSTSHRKKLEKERQTLIKQREELQAFDEQLRHYADQRIKLDLDDGVKVNYSRFGNLLAEVKAITGNSL